MARSLKAKNVLLKSDSRLVIGQINGEYETKETRMQRYLKLTNQMIGELEKVNFIQVPRSRNLKADEVGRYASSNNRTSLPESNARSTEVPQHQRIPHILDTR